MLSGGRATSFLGPHRLECGGEARGLCGMVQERGFAEVVAETVAEDGALG